MNDMEHTETGQDSEGKGDPSTTEAFLQVLDVLEQVRYVANSERTSLIDDGWSPEAAESMAMAVYGSVLSQIMGTDSL